MLRHEYEKGFADKTSDELIRLIRELGGNAFPYLDYDQLLHTKQVESLQVLEDVSLPAGGKMRMIGVPWQGTELTPEMRTTTPRLGEHTQEVMRSTGRDPATIPGAMDGSPKFLGRVCKPLDKR